MTWKLPQLLKGPERRYWRFLIFLFLLALVPLGTAARIYSTFYLRFGTELLIFGLFALSVDIIMGYTGLVSLGPAAFFGLGAYTGALTLIHLADSIWLAFLATILLSGVVAWLIGYLSIRIKGVYFAMLTLAFAEMFHEVAFNWQSLTGGSDGLIGVPRPEVGIAPLAVSLGNSYVLFYLVLFVVIAVYYGCVRLVNSPFGRVLQAIRDNEERAEFVGYDIRVFKRRAFVVSGIIAGVSGTLFALLRFVDPDVFNWLTSAEVLVMNLFGGMGTLYGPIIGAMVFLFARDLISSYTEHWRIILGGIFVAFVIYSPQGIVGLSRSLVSWVSTAVNLPLPRGAARKTPAPIPPLGGAAHVDPEQDSPMKSELGR
ncbi:MAG: branched-chain amino acid ABC transporter permease [Deltaproteobacteria bacterium]|nr:branched-chain amino acid ABC transporter permease [Deltaproteobacteria bacterium]